MHFKEIDYVNELQCEFEYHVVRTQRYSILNLSFSITSTIQSKFSLSISLDNNEL